VHGADHDDMPAPHEHEIEHKKADNDGIMVERMAVLCEAAKDEKNARKQGCTRKHDALQPAAKR